MPVHDWTHVEDGIFHHFHHSWIEEIQRALNAGLLPDQYYALAEQHAAGFGPDVLTLQSATPIEDNGDAPQLSGNGGGLLVAPPHVHFTAETDRQFYRRKQNTVTVRHVSGDQVVAMIEIVSAGNKSGQNALRSFVEKAARLLDRRIHLLIVDVHPPTSRDPAGIHGAVWEEMTGLQYEAPVDKPLTLVAYESELTVRAFVEPIAVGSQLIDMPLFLEPGGYVAVPLEATYQRAFDAMPRRWRSVVDS